MPLLRFATGDMMTYYESACACGNEGYRLGPVIGRKQQKIKLKGTSLYPQHIIEALLEYGKLQTFVIEASHDEFSNDQVLVIVPDSFTSISELKEFFRSRLQVTPEIKLLATDEIEKLKFPKNSRKPQIFRDFR